mgnify:FL=1
MTINLKISTFLIIVIFLFVLFAGLLIVSQTKEERIISSQMASLIQPVLAEEIYPLFLCPCCGQPLDKNNICCGMAEERINYIDSLVDQNLSEKEIILAFVKKYGLNSFVNQEKEKEVREWLLAIAPVDRPIISLSPDSYDFGNVSQKAGKVYTYFDLKNEGKSDLIIDRIGTSCGCTFVAIIYKDKESPFFTMPGHGYTNPEWEGISIPPGETAQLKVMYDPDVHKNFRGFAIREVYVYSNDPIDFEKKIWIELNQTD